MPKVRSFTVLPALPDCLKDLEVVARNMFWCWNPEFVQLFRRVDSNLWVTSGCNPIKLLGSLPQGRLEELSKNQGFLSELQNCVEKLNSYLEGPTWYDQNCPKEDRPVIAYFSAEFGLHECLPIYAGGLGILAGDHLKSASDLGVPLIGVGLLYQKGYFRQYLNIDGWQQEVYAESDFYNMPIELVRDADGKPLTISVEYPERKVSAQIWCVLVGRVKLYLLDTNIADNSPGDRLITASLYGGDVELRIRQEMMLGIGGFRALSALGISPSVCHMNEGHAAFMALERVRQLRSEKKMSFAEALEATKSSNIFTMHTPVKAGLDEFRPELVDKYFGEYLPALGVSRDEFLALGRILVDHDDETFKMPIMALKLSSFRNAVSKCHGDVSRRMWSGLWPDLPVEEVPIISITNGVHIKSWLSEELNLLYERYLGANWSEETSNRQIWENIDQIPDEQLWRTHQRCKERLVAFARNRLKAQIERRGTYHTELNWAEEVLDPEALTIGFARRFAEYKRGNLLLRDPKRLMKLLGNSERPVQLVFAGKAHPKDTKGKDIIHQIIAFANQYNWRRRIVFLEDYDINVARILMRGVDVWLNTPRPPLEASGTSGMKAALNGALNMSVFDGWWCEGYKSECGWVIGTGEVYEDANYQDMVESQVIYNILENEVVPLFYSRSASNFPRGWVRRMKNSIKWIAPRFNTHRMVEEYTQKFYNPAATKWRHFSAESMSRAKALSMWKSNMRNAWCEFAIEDVQVHVRNGQGKEELDEKARPLKVGSELHVRALVKLGSISPENVSVELYHGMVDSWGNISKGSAVRMDYQETCEGDGKHWFSGVVPCRTSGRQGVAVRILPRHSDMASPYELGLVLWETNVAK